jgi:2-polyprenyl-3-methyl-5-hydroxy-6-metoxy-1,4-benzoquinol methylase
VIEAKPSGYYARDRPELVSAVPRPIGRVLDVGCGEGRVGRALRRAGAEWLTGVEVVEAAAAVAREAYDEVLTGRVEDRLADARGPFDTICCYDVLEHLVDPDTVLRRLLPLASPGGRLHVSVPNARQIGLVKDLLFRGTFGYVDEGHRDRTHLRWFTPRDIVDAITDAGWDVVSTSHPPLRRSAALDRLTRGRSTPFLVDQWFVLARAPR